MFSVNPVLAVLYILTGIAFLSAIVGISVIEPIILNECTIPPGLSLDDGTIKLVYGKPPPGLLVLSG